ncbi:Hypothetical predicted protein [Marmota monax]|uniref:Uncharacterized protein n=1 Tax=Marmota monax TaxID=9995 RepID=A0A5E4BU33_MARMO|nr:Hypothetical predicted protein [Marmota monax]
MPATLCAVVKTLTSPRGLGEVEAEFVDEDIDDDILCAKKVVKDPKSMSFDKEIEFVDEDIDDDILCAKKVVKDPKSMSFDKEIGEEIVKGRAIVCQDEPRYHGFVEKIVPRKELHPPPPHTPELSMWHNPNPNPNPPAKNSPPNSTPQQFTRHKIHIDFRILIVLDRSTPPRVDINVTEPSDSVLLMFKLRSESLNRSGTEFF